LATDLNVIVLNGRLTQNAETKDVGEQTVTEFRLAYTQRVKSEDVSGFINCSMWGHGGVVQYLVKGKQVSITGSLRFREWQAQDGSKRSVHEVSVRDVQLLGEKKDVAPEPSKPVGSSAGDEEIPFGPSII
jgi:single-strand DNA-binding protein